MNFTDYLTEVSDKDWDRMQTLINKKSDGAGVAKSIKDKTKAIDRYVAGLKLTNSELVFPRFSGSFADFGNKAIELGASYSEIKRAYDGANSSDANSVKDDSAKDDSAKDDSDDVKVGPWVPKKRKSGSAPQKGDRYNASAILSIGSISLKTGKSKYFNVYEEWLEDSVYEIWELSPGKYRITVTSGTKPIFDIGDEAYFKGDQSGRDLGKGKMVDWALGTDLKNAAKTYGGTIAAFVYK